MRRMRLGVIAWKVLLYLVVGVVLAGLTRDLTLAAVLTVGFAAGDGSVAVLLRRHPHAEPATPSPDPPGLERPHV